MILLKNNLLRAPLWVFTLALWEQPAHVLNFVEFMHLAVTPLKV